MREPFDKHSHSIILFIGADRYFIGTRQQDTSKVHITSFSNRLKCSEAMAKWAVNYLKKKWNLDVLIWHNRRHS